MTFALPREDCRHVGGKNGDEIRLGRRRRWSRALTGPGRTTREASRDDITDGRRTAVTFLALVLVAAGALGRGPQLLLLRTGKADVLLVLLVKPFGRRRRVPGPLVLAGRVDAAAAGRRLRLAVGRRRAELMRRPGRLADVGPVPVRRTFRLTAAVIVVPGLQNALAVQPVQLKRKPGATRVFRFENHNKNARRAPHRVKRDYS